MNKKQIIGLVVAGLVFTFVCSVNVLTKNVENKRNNLATLSERLAAVDEKFNFPTDDFISVVSIDGTIQDVEYSFGASGYNHKRTMKLIDQLIDSPNNKGILLKVNSPGGSVYTSDEIYFKLKEYKETTNRPIITYMEDYAASGGYYVAMQSDKIVSNRNAITGSIGVVIQMQDLTGFAEKVGINVKSITSGNNKSIGSPWEDMRPDQIDIYQSIVDESYNQFLEIISDGRGIPKKELIPIADGRIYTATQALELNLIDEIANYEDLITSLEIEYSAKVFIPKVDTFSLSSLYYKALSLKPKTESEIFMDMINDNRNGVLMYYAQ